MQARSLTLNALLGAVILMGAYQAQETDLLKLNVNETILFGAANLLLIYFVLALLIERACEVVMDLLTSLALVPNKSAPDQVHANSKRRTASILVCLTFATFISAAGLRLVEMILVLAAPDGVSPEGYFNFMDALLTSFILAGGSEGIHQIIRSLIGDKTHIPGTP